MSSAKITLIGMANYYTMRGDDLFKHLSFPEGIDREAAINTILLRGAEFEVLYSNGDFMQEAIGNWSKIWNRTFDKWQKALQIDYNPLENYDRIEKSTDTNTGTIKNTGTQDALSKVSGYNSEDLKDDSATTREDDLTQTNDLTLEREARTHGNIGVTTSQQMLQSELDIAAWNLYEHIADIFLKDFVLPVY